MAFRAFVGVPVEPAPSLVALLEALARTKGDLKVVDPALLHFTLSFLGNVPDDAAAPIASALDAAVTGLAPFRAQLEGVGAFPNARRPRVVWAGVADPPPLVALATRVREALAAAGYPGDAKDFRAHLTLARTRSERDLAHVVAFLREHAHDPLPDVPIEEARLYRSVLSPQGPSYETLHTARLEA